MISWNYGGSTSISVTLDTVAGHSYNFVVEDAVTQHVDGFTGTGSPMTRTISGLSGLSAGDIFNARLEDTTGFSWFAANNFAYGTASTTGEGITAEWAYDGAETVTCRITGTPGVLYYLRASYYSGSTGYQEDSGDDTGTGSPMTLSLTLAHTPSSTFIVQVSLDQDTFTGQGSRVFDAGVADAGTGGNPEGGDPTFVGRVLIAFDDGPHEPAPAFVAIDQGGDFPQNFVSGYDTANGKQSNIAQTDTGTATVYIFDRAGLFDPRNMASPYFGKLDGKQILLQLRDPVTDVWESQFQGWIDEATYDIDATTDAFGVPINATIQLNCVDMFDELAGFGLTPGLAGDAPPNGQEDGVYYPNEHVDDRMIHILTDVGIDSTRYGSPSLASGNVRCIETKYDPDESALTALRDAADAEFPFISNIYIDRFGRFQFRGRYGRFDPDDVAAEPGSDWDFTRWGLGDGVAIQSDPTRAQMRVLSFLRGRANVINAAVCYPQGIKATDMIDQVFADTTSIDDYGKHDAPPMTDLLTADDGLESGSANANVECFKFAKLRVLNQKDPRESISSLQVKTVDPADARATQTWAFLTQSDISHIVNVAVGYPGGAGFEGTSPDDDYYIEGRQLRVRPLTPAYDYVELDVEVSPAVWSMDTHGVFPVFS